MSSHYTISTSHTVHSNTDHTQLHQTDHEEGIATTHDVIISDEVQQSALGALSRASAYQGLNDLAQRLLEIRQWMSDDLVLLEERLSQVATRSSLARQALASQANDVRRYEYNHQSNLEPIESVFAHDIREDSVAWACADYLLARPGKRVRPLCVMLAARMGNRAFDESVQAIALACELVHAATLLHDDVIDLGDERRGAATARVIYSNAASVLGGDHLLLDALKRVRAIRHDLIYDELLDVIDLMIDGEALQLERRGRCVVDRNAYMQVAEGKTASLFQWALRSGARLAGLNTQQVDDLGTVGVHIGLAFQLVDDVLDLEGDVATMGKVPLIDLKEGKLTWPLILASEQNPEILPAIEHLMSLLSCVEDDTSHTNHSEHDNPLQTQIQASIEGLMNMIKDTSAISDTKQLAQERVEQAKTILSHMPAGPSNQALLTVLDSIIARSA